MNIFKKSLILLFIILTVVLGFWNLKSRSQNSSIQNERIVQEFKATLTINDGKTNPTFDIQQHIGKTVLETLQSVLNGNLKNSGAGENAFLTSLNGRDADAKKHEFWELIVNGKQAKVGAGSYKIQNNDVIVWKINTY